MIGGFFLFYSLSSPTPGSEISSSDSVYISLDSPQWAGYAVMSNLLLRQALVTSVSGSWTVPSANISLGDTYSAAWIGISGYGENSLVQIGTLHGARMAKRFTMLSTNSCQAQR